MLRVCSSGNVYVTRLIIVYSYDDIVFARRVFTTAHMFVLLCVSVCESACPFARPPLCNKRPCNKRARCKVCGR